MSTKEHSNKATFANQKTFSAQELEQSIQSGLAFDGQPAQVFTLINSNNMSVSIMDIGATWVSCILPLDNQPREVLLGMTKIEDYASHTAFLGAIVGRFANRINCGQFAINQQHYQLTVNDGENTLHGGIDGFDKRRWTVKEHSNNHVVFCLQSGDGDQGFPGNLSVEVVYTLTECNQVCIEYSALCDQDCPINLTNHAYFNLDGAESNQTILDHTLWLKSSYYAATDKNLIPTGELKSVSNTSFDFNQAQSIGARLLEDTDQKFAKGYDHAFTFDLQDCDGITPVAELTSGDKKVTMSVLTDKPAIQFYSGNFLAGTPSRNSSYQDYQGVALETQFLPDAPNQNWPEGNKAFIAKKSFYQYQTSYQFSF